VRLRQLQQKNEDMDLGRIANCVTHRFDILWRADTTPHAYNIWAAGHRGTTATEQYVGLMLESMRRLLNGIGMQKVVTLLITSLGPTVADVAQSLKL